MITFDVNDFTRTAAILHGAPSLLQPGRLAPAATVLNAGGPRELRDVIAVDTDGDGRLNPAASYLDRRARGESWIAVF